MTPNKSNEPLQFTWEQKLQALSCLGRISLNMRSPGDWYVNHSFSRSEGIIYSGGCVSGAKTPQEAVEQCWEWAIDQRFHMVINPNGDREEHVIWAGFMWRKFN